MYEICKSVISRKEYELCDMLKKLKTFWVDSSITEEQYSELVLLSQENAKVENSIDSQKWRESVEERLAKLEHAGVPEPPEPTVEEFVAGKWYKNGDKILWHGETYRCIAPEGQTCVWSPDDYPAYWQKG